MFPGSANIAQEKPLLVSWEPMRLLHTFGRAGHGAQSVPIILRFSRSASVVISVAFCLHIDPSPYHRGKAPEGWPLSSWWRQFWEAVVLRQWFMVVRGGRLHHTGNEEADRLLSCRGPWTEWYCGERQWCDFSHEFIYTHLLLGWNPLKVSRLHFPIASLNTTEKLATHLHFRMSIAAFKIDGACYLKVLAIEES